MVDYAIKINNLSKKYGKLSAVDGVSFRVKRGISFGLLGPNGAGKTTTLKMMTSLIRPDGGSAVIAGYDVRKEAMQVRRHIGYVSETPTFYPRMTTIETLQYLGKLLDIPGKVLQKRIDSNLELVGLKEKRNNYVGEYSRGMRHRLSLAQALLSDPEVLFLDEPTLGLDPIGARDIRNLIVQLKQRNDVTIVMSSHTLPEVERICDEIAVFNHGKIIAQDSVEKLRHTVGGSNLEIRLVEKAEQAAAALKELEFINEISINGNRLLITYSGDQEVRPLMLEKVFNVNRQILFFGAKEISLEDILFKLLQDNQGAKPM